MVEHCYKDSWRLVWHLFSDWMMRYHMVPQTQLTIGCVMFATKRHTRTHVYYLHMFRYIGLTSFNTVYWLEPIPLDDSYKIRFFECFGYACVCMLLCPDVRLDVCLFHSMTLYPFPLDMIYLLKYAHGFTVIWCNLLVYTGTYVCMRLQTPQKAFGDPLYAPLWCWTSIM